MADFRLRPEALHDLGAIWEYTVDQWDSDQAAKYLRLLNANLEKLAQNPEFGRPCNWIRQGYRKHLVGKHVIFYRIADTYVDVVRVLHQSMDFDRHL